MTALTLALHLLFFALGALLIRRLHAPVEPDEWRAIRWLAAYPLGLVCNLVVAFTADQLLGARLSPPVLLTIASTLLLAAGVLVPRVEHVGVAPRPPGPARWHLGEAALLVVSACVLTLRHRLDSPLSDWDSLMYHLPLAESVRGGRFPDEIGRSYVRQYEAAFPPLIYFLYGLLPDALSVVSIRVVGLLVNAGLCLLSCHVARRVLGASRVWGLVAAVATATLVNPEPNTQGITALYLGLTFVFAVDAFDAGEEHGRTPKRRARCFLVALLGAGCYWTSYLGIGLLGTLYPALALGAGMRRRSRPTSFDWSGWLGTGLLTLLLITPHLIRNWRAAGNPFYPAFAELLGGVGFSDWFLANRPPAGTAIEHPWSLVALSFARWSPLPQWILAGASATLLARPPGRARRAQVFLLLFGFLVLWMSRFQRHNTPLDRYLIPLAPIATAAVASSLSRIARDRDVRSLLSLLPIGGIFATSLLSARAMQEDPISAPVFLSWLGACTLGAWCLAWWTSRSRAEQRDPPAPPPRAPFAGIALRARPLLVGTLLLAAGLLIGTSRWPRANRYRAPTADDLTWMNTYLPESSRILIFDGRVLGLERDWVPIDDASLDAFSRAPDRDAAARELKALGITHFYYSLEAWNLIPATFDIDFFAPQEGNVHCQLVYSSETGWIVALR